MATLKTATVTLLENDATFAALATGGVRDALDLDAHGLELEGLTDTEGRIMPCAVLRWRAARPAELAGYSELRTLEIYFYEASGQATIDQMMSRCKRLLDRQLIAADGTGANMFQWVEDFGEFYDPALGAVGNFSRYTVRYTVNERK